LEIVVVEVLDSLMGCDLGNICAKAERQTSEKSVNKGRIIEQELKNTTKDAKENSIKNVKKTVELVSND
jgi:hypothetical protein